VKTNLGGLGWYLGPPLFQERGRKKKAGAKQGKEDYQ
jgi:hypothetical protein